MTDLQFKTAHGKALIFTWIKGSVCQSQFDPEGDGGNLGTLPVVMST